MNHDFLNMTYKALCDEVSYARGFFSSMALDMPQEHETIRMYFNGLDPYQMEEKGLEAAALPRQFLEYLEQMKQHLESSSDELVESITIIGGKNKSGQPEGVELTLHKGDVVSIVGPTGSGKSRLLADIEWLAQKDTPTGRQILINGEAPPSEWRFSIERKLVAQLSQNMNFVMDLSVEEFIHFHMESRMITDPDNEKAGLILSEANRLAGEAIFPDTPITALSGGQSRSLMIADTAYLSTSPIVLIDEIENAGIDKQMALDLLIRREKIVLAATHDPALALRADRRVIIKNGGIYKVIETTSKEKEILLELDAINAKELYYRELLKRGERME